jgi:hypothetical protein
MVEGIRDRVMPMLQVAVETYRGRVPEGYPVIVDRPEQGVVGIELDPAYALYFASDGDGLVADFYYRSSRFDARSSASREKFGGSPFHDRRPLAPAVTDQGLRNLIAELFSRFNFQQTIIHITDM